MTYRLGEIKRRGGFVTAEKFLLQQHLREIERRLGYHSGRLMKGACFLLYITTPTLQDLSFEFSGYSQVPGHRFQPSVELDQKKAKENLIHYWRRENIHLVKVIPVIGHQEDMNTDAQYPPGSGVPQWKLTKDYMARVVALYSREDYMNGTPYQRLIF